MENKTIAVVTGASSGIGREFFLALQDKAPHLQEIWVVARNEKKLQELCSLTSIPVRIFALDLSLSQSVTELENAFKSEQPQIAYLICASGFGRFCAVEEDDTATLENMIDLNCKSIVSLTKAAAPFIKKGGAMLLVASVAALQPTPYIATYAASKAFVLSYGRAFNRELQATRGARCMCVCPFWTKTAFFDRAETQKTVVKKYVVMYEPKQIVTRAFKDLKHKKRDVSICGFVSRGQALLVKLLPHKLVMSIWQNQQKLP